MRDLFLRRGSRGDFQEHLEENSKHGVLISGEDSSVTVADKRFFQQCGTGVSVLRSFGRGRDCEFVANQVGIFARGGNNVVLSGNRARQNREHGISLYEMATSTISRNVCEMNGLNGIQVQHGNESTISDNQCIQNEHNGLALLGRNLKATATRNLAKNNKWQGIFAGQTVQGDLIENQSIGNAKNGIYADNSDVSCRENVCEGNEYSGINAEKRVDGGLSEQYLPTEQVLWHRGVGRVFHAGLRRQPLRGKYQRPVLSGGTTVRTGS